MEGWIFKPAAVSQIMRSRVQTAIVRLKEICICDVINLFISLHCEVIQTPSVQTLYVYFSSSVQSLFSSYGSSGLTNAINTTECEIKVESRLIRARRRVKVKPWT